jgi:hypothetical protein
MAERETECAGAATVTPVGYEIARFRAKLPDDLVSESDTASGRAGPPAATRILAPVVELI